MSKLISDCCGAEIKLGMEHRHSTDLHCAKCGKECQETVLYNNPEYIKEFNDKKKSNS